MERPIANYLINSDKCPLSNKCPILDFFITMHVEKCEFLLQGTSRPRDWPANLLGYFVKHGGENYYYNYQKMETYSNKNAGGLEVSCELSDISDSQSLVTAASA